MIAGFIVALLLSFQTPSLPDDHRRWLDEDVRYIITDEEREFFLSLETRDERERAIEAFWDNRDPDRLTPENEYRDEHYRRIERANRLFGPSATRAGYLTERGHYYILLGEPVRVERFLGSNEIVTSEIWFYNGDTSQGLPPRFNLVFFKERDVGDYQLYSPIDDGPAALLIARVSFQQERNAALDVIEATSMDLARASLTVDLTEAVGSFLGRYTGLTLDGRPEDPTIPLHVRPSSSSNLVIAIATELGTSGVDTDYIDGYRRYRSRVSSEYSFGYISNRDYWTVLYDRGGSPFVHFSIELDPEDMTFRRNEDGSFYETRLRVDIEVRDRSGGFVAIPSRDPYIQLSAEQIEIAKARPVSYQDSFPLIPGAYQIAVTLRNLSGEHFTVAERNLSVAALPQEAPALGGVAVGYDVVAPQERGSFASRGHRVLPAGRAYFPKGGTVHAFAQLIDRGGDALVRVSLSGPSGVSERYQVRSSGGIATQPIALDDVAPGSYSVLFELIGPGGEALVTKSSAFDVVGREGLVRPALIYRNVVSDPEPDFTAITMSDQYVARGQLAEAERELRVALGIDGPRVDVVRWKLASVLLYTGQGAEALDLLLPLETGYPDQAEVIEGLGFAYYLLKDCEKALPRLEYAMALRPPDISVLNATGDCYQQLGRVRKAREMFELSLSVNPNQEGVVSRLSELPVQ